MNDSDYATILREIGGNTEALGFVLGRMIARKPTSVAEAIDELDQIQQGLTDMGEGLVSSEAISDVATGLKIGLGQSESGG